MDAHIFIDNSNIFGGARRAGGTRGECAPAVRVYYRNLFRLLEAGLHPVTRVMAGAVPPGNDELWEYSRKAQYDTSLLKKVVNDDGDLGEQGVDEILHLRIANALLDHSAPQTLVIATGDGKESDFGTSFYAQAVRALKHGWGVDLWSWEAQLSGRFRRLEQESKGFFQVCLLDPHYRQITFSKAGTYTHSGQVVTAVERVVDHMP